MIRGGIKGEKNGGLRREIIEFGSIMKFQIPILSFACMF